MADYPGDVGPFDIVSRLPGEVLRHRIEWVGGQFGEDASQTMLDIVNVVEKRAPIEMELRAAELPVGTEQEVVLKEAVLEIFECPPADQAEVSHEFFPFS